MLYIFLLICICKVGKLREALNFRLTGKNMNTKFKEKTWEIVFLFAAAFSILAVLLICLFLFANGIPAMHKIGWLDFLFGKTWKPGNEQFGIFPMIVGSLYVTAGAIIFGVPIGLMTAI